MKKSYKGVYIREIIKVIFITTFVLFFLVSILWGCLFVTDYMMFKNGKPTVFTNSHIETTENGRIIYEDGVFYHVVVNEKGEKQLYLFDKEIIIK